MSEIIYAHIRFKDRDGNVKTSTLSAGDIHNPDGLFKALKEAGHTDIEFELSRDLEPKFETPAP